MRAANILNLGIKELRGLARDPIMIVLIVFAFTFSVYTAATAMPDGLNRATIAIVDDDMSPVSARIASAFYQPYFMPPHLITITGMDARMDAGLDTFALNIPPEFQRDLLAGKTPEIQLNVDATRMAQAFAGTGYIQQIVTAEISEYSDRYRSASAPSVDLALRARFNPGLDASWFGAVTSLISSITMLSIVLTGAALIREKEHGTIEHLLVMPVTALEIMLSKIWSMALVVFAATVFSLAVVVQGVLGVPILGSLPLFLAGTALMMLAMTLLGIFLATVAGTMPRLALSAGMTPALPTFCAHQRRCDIRFPIVPADRR